MRRPRPATPAERAALRQMGGLRLPAASLPALSAETWLRCADDKFCGPSRASISRARRRRARGPARLRTSAAPIYKADRHAVGARSLERADGCHALIGVELRPLRQAETDGVVDAQRQVLRAPGAPDLARPNSGGAQKHAPKNLPNPAQERILWSLEIVTWRASYFPIPGKAERRRRADRQGGERALAGQFQKRRPPPSSEVRVQGLAERMACPKFILLLHGDGSSTRRRWTFARPGSTRNSGICCGVRARQQIGHMVPETMLPPDGDREREMWNKGRRARVRLIRSGMRRRANPSRWKEQFEMDVSDAQ